MRQKEEPLLRELNIVNKDSLGIYRKGLSVRTSWSDLGRICRGICVCVCLGRIGPGICIWVGFAREYVCIWVGFAQECVYIWAGLAQEYVSG